MKQKSLSKVFAPLFLALAVVVSCFGGIFYFHSKSRNNEIYAEGEEITSPVVIGKTKEDSTRGFSYIFDGNGTETADVNKEENYIQSNLDGNFKNNEFILLNEGEFVFIGFNIEKLNRQGDSYTKPTTSDQSSFYTLQVNAYLNGKSLKTNESIKNQGIEESKYYYHILCLTQGDLQYSDGTTVPQEEIEGHYKFVFEYTEKEGEVVKPQANKTVEFFAFNKSTYSNQTTEHKEPRLFNTEKIDRDVYGSDMQYQAQYNYFNYNNNDTTDYYGDKTTTGDTLKFPTIEFDVTKYALRYTKTLYGTKTSYEYVVNNATSEDFSDSAYKLEYYVNNVFQQVIPTSEITNNIYKVKLNEIGEYDIEFNFVFADLEYDKFSQKYKRNGYPNSKDQNNASYVKWENWDNLVGNQKLYIFGYQLMHSDYSNSQVSNNKEFTNGSDLFTDVSFMQNNNIESFNNGSLDLTKIIENTEIDLCSTNQAPVSLKYYASMTLDSNTTKSYYKYWNSYQSFKNGDIPTISDENITNNTRFTRNGYYQIFIEYNFAEYNKQEENKLQINPNEVNHYQFFSFSINNSEPKLYVKTNEDIPKNVSTESFTNKSVDISWEANTIFDIAPRIEIKKQIFGNDNWITIYNNSKTSNILYGLTYSPIGESQDKERIAISNDFNGYYIITINYGPGTQTLAKYRFSIDTANIGGILTKAILNNNSNNNEITHQDYASTQGEQFDILNSAFMLDWKEKDSGAKISVNYTFIPLEQNDSLLNNNSSLLPDLEENESANEINNYLNNGTNPLNLYTNYELKTLNENLSYEKPVLKNENQLTNINSMKTSAGLYLFSFVDEAGNTAKKIVMIDNSTPSVYVYVNEQETYQLANDEHIIATRDAIMIWGDNKIIGIDSGSNVQETLNGYLETEIINNKIFVPISNVKLNIDETQQKIIENGNHKLFTLEKQVRTNNVEICDTGHKNDCVVINGISTTNKVFENIAKTVLEMNSDNSLLMFYSTDNASTDELNNNDRIKENKATNDSFVYFEWIQNNGNEFEVKEITYYFYPLTFEGNPISNLNYPFSQNYTKSESVDLIQAINSPVNENKVMSGKINLEKDNSATIEGLYVVKREYLHEIGSAIYDDGNVTKDYSPRYYSFFVERNKVVSKTLSGVLIGEQIGLNIGSNENSPENYQKQFKGEDFLIDLNIENNKFRTSKLPVEFINEITSLNKFNTENKTILSINDTLELDRDTELTIQKYIYDNFKLSDPIIKYKKNKNDINYATAQELNLNENDIKLFKIDGFYEVTLREENARNDKNDFVFTFQVSVPTPSANIIKHSQNDQNNYEYLYYPETEKDISTNNKNIIVGWNKPQSISGYDAEIDANNFSIRLTLEDASKNILLNIVNNNVIINGTSKQLKVIDMADNSQLTKKFVNPSWDYYIDFEDIFSILPSEYELQSVKVDLTLHYYGQEEDYSKTVYSVVKTIVFDFEKPSHNYNRLVQSDGYLNYYNNHSDNDFNNPESEVNFENYAFTIGGDFTFETKVFESGSLFTNSNMDTNKMFIRKYNKYLNETAVNQQSLTPDDSRYEERAKYPNRYRFDENLEINGEKVYQEISEYYYNTEAGHNYNFSSILTAIYGYNESIFDSYYEIIEIDYAGNYRVYTVYLPSEETQEISYLTNSTTEPQTKEMKSIIRYTVNQNNSISLKTINETLLEIENRSFSKIFSVALDFDVSALINQFVTIEIVNISANTINVFTLAPSTNLEQLNQRLNQTISPFNEINGNIYYITILTSRLDLLKVEHRKPSNDYPIYWFTDGTTGFEIEFYVDTQNENSSAFITEFNVYKAENGEKKQNPENEDSNRKTIITEIEEYFLSNGITEYNFKYTFKLSGSSGSEYFVEFLDNFNRKRVVRKIIGVEDNQDKVIYSAPDENIQSKNAQINKGIDGNVGYENVTIQFTNQSVTLRWQSILNSVNIRKYSLQYISGQLTLIDLGEDGKYELDNNLTNKSVLTGIWTYPLIKNEGENNIVYEVIFASTQGDEVYYIAYDNSLAEINIVNASDASIKRKAENQEKYNFDTTVKISFNQIGQNFPTLINIKREYLDQNNQPRIDFIGIVESGYLLNNIGKYTITCYNNLGTSIQFEINIETKVNNNYWVIYLINGIEAGKLKETNTNIYASDYGTSTNPITFVTIYDYEVKYNLANGYSIAQEQVVSESANHKTTLYRIVQTLNDVEQPNAKYIQVSKIAKNSNFIRNYENHFWINNKIVNTNESEKPIYQDQITKAKTAVLKLTQNYNLVPENSIVLSYKFNGNFVKELYLNRMTEAQLQIALTMVDSGVYEFYFTDLAGNKQAFGNNDHFTMYLLCDVLFNVNSKQSVDNAVFNGPVKIDLQQVDKFSSIKIESKLNGKDIKIPKIGKSSYTFTDFGSYNITFIGKIDNNQITTTYNFRIVNYNESMATFEYVGLNNYEIVEVIKLDSKDSLIGDNITEYIKSTTKVNHIRSLALSSLENGLGGAGYYLIKVDTRYTTSKIDQSFNFKVWINNDSDVLIKCSIPFGDSTTKNISLSLNKNQIYNKIGDCYIMLNDSIWIDINQASSQQNATSYYTVTENGTYNIRVVSQSGNTLQSFIITKNEPLNAVAIIVIILSSAVVITLIIIIIKMRKHMKVK